MKQREIDISLIWRKLNDSLTNEEEMLLESWLQSNPQHKDYFKRAKAYYKDGEVLNEKEFNVQQMWNQFEPLLKSQKRKIPYLWPKIAGAASLLILCVVSAYMVLNIKPSDVPLSKRLNKEIPPGISMAKLTLDDGKTISLNNNEEFVASIQNTEIKNDRSKLIYSGKDVKSMTDFKPKYHILNIERGHKYDLVLEDGTKVWLNSETKMRYPVKFDPNGDRIVEIIGEAYLMVAKDANRPFKVKTGDQIIEVLGTEFNICAYEDELNIHTTLAEGRIKISNQLNENVYEMEPGYQLNFSKETGDAYKAKVNVEEYISWRNDLYLFKSKRLEDIMKTLTRWYDIEFIFENEKYKDIRFTGEFDRSKNLENILEILEHTNEMRFKSDYEGIVIY